MENHGGQPLFCFVYFLGYIVVFAFGMLHLCIVVFLCTKIALDLASWKIILITM